MVGRHKDAHVDVRVEAVLLRKVARVVFDRVPQVGERGLEAGGRGAHEKAQEKAFFLYFATARPEVERACKKAVLAWKAAERAAHAKDAPRAAQLAARASTLAKMALAKEAVFLALPTEFEMNVANFKKYLSPFVAEAAEAAVLAQQAAVRAAM